MQSDIRWASGHGGLYRSNESRYPWIYRQLPHFLSRQYWIVLPYLQGKRQGTQVLCFCGQTWYVPHCCLLREKRFWIPVWIFSDIQGNKISRWTRRNLFAEQGHKMLAHEIYEKHRWEDRWSMLYSQCLRKCCAAKGQHRPVQIVFSIFHRVPKNGKDACFFRVRELLGGAVLPKDCFLLPFYHCAGQQSLFHRVLQRRNGERRSVGDPEEDCPKFGGATIKRGPPKIEGNRRLYPKWLEYLLHSVL